MRSRQGILLFIRSDHALGRGKRSAHVASILFFIHAQGKQPQPTAWHGTPTFKFHILHDFIESSVLLLSRLLAGPASCLPFQTLCPAHSASCLVLSLPPPPLWIPPGVWHKSADHCLEVVRHDRQQEASSLRFSSGLSSLCTLSFHRKSKVSF